MEKKEPEEKKTNWFSRVLIVLLVLFVGFLVVASSWPCPWKLTLTGESVILVALLAVLALSEVFDHFRIGSLLTLQREKRAKEEQLQEVAADNRQLREQLTTIVSNSVANNNTAFFGWPTQEQMASLFGTKPAGKDEVDKKEKEEHSSDESSAESSAPVAGSASESHNRTQTEVMDRRRMQPRIEALCMDRYCELIHVSKYSISRATKFSDAFVDIDPIMEQNIIFDAYYRSPQGEQFIEVVTGSGMGNNMYRLYHVLSKIYYYRNATRQQAKLVILAAQLPESYYSNHTSYIINAMTERRLADLQKTFAPAIRNRLLEIIPIEITDDDIDRIKSDLAEKFTDLRTNEQR